MTSHVQTSLFFDGRCGWCGHAIMNGANDATICPACVEESKRRQAGKEPISHKSAEIVYLPTEGT